MHKMRNAFMWTFIGIVFIVGIIVFLGALNDFGGEPLIEQPGALLGSLFTSLGVIATGVFAVVMKTEKNSEIVRENTQVAREQLENSHIKDPTKVSNIRDDLDTKASTHELNALGHSLQESLSRMNETILSQMRESFASLDRRVDGTSSDVRGIRKDIVSLNEKHERMDDRVDELKIATDSIQFSIKSGL